MKTEKRKIIKAIAIFLGVMLVFTLISVKVDYYMTPEVQTTFPQRGVLSFELNATGTASGGNVSFSLDLTQEKYLKEGDGVQLAFLNQSNTVTAVIREKKFDPESQTVLFNCRMVGNPEVYDGQNCTVTYQHILGEYNILLPRECIRQSGENAFVYMVETVQGVLGEYELVKQVNVTVIDTDEFNAAVEAPLSEHHRVIRASSKPIYGDQKVRSQP